MGDKIGIHSSRENPWKKDGGAIYTQGDLRMPINSHSVQLDLLERVHKPDRDESELRYRASKVNLEDNVEYYVNSRFIIPINEKLEVHDGQLVYLVSRGYRDVGVSSEKPDFIKVTKRHIGILSDKSHIPQDAVSVGSKKVLMEGLESSFGIEYDRELREEVLARNEIPEFSFSLRNNSVLTSRFYALRDLSPSSPSGKVCDHSAGDPRLELYIGLSALNAIKKLNAHYYLSLQRHLGESVLPIDQEILRKDDKERLHYITELTKLRRNPNHLEIMRLLKTGIARGYHLEEDYVNLHSGDHEVCRVDIKRHIQALSNCYNINVPSS